MYILKEICDNERCANSKCYVQRCFEAIKSVDSKDVSFKEDDETWSKVYERNFIISMAYKYGWVEAKINNSTNISTVSLINGEVRKKIDTSGIPFWPNLYSRIKHKEYENGKIDVYPDFLIHESHNPQEKRGQHLILEAKSGKIQKDDFNWDFLKLNLYIHLLGFECAIYLIVGETKDDVNQHLKKYQELNNTWMVNNENIHRLYFIIKEKLEEETRIYQLVEEQNDKL